MRTILTPLPPFQKKSKWTPPTNREAALENYIVSVERKIHRQVNQRPLSRSTDNITIPKRRVLSSLQKRSDIVIKPADKGTATVVMSRDAYLTQVMEHLNNITIQYSIVQYSIERFWEEIRAT